MILGGTLEATALCARVSGEKLPATLSLAGRVARPKRQPLPVRVGGFGGVEGLCDYLVGNSVTHIIDATHPFASQMSLNAVAASSRVGIPLVALARPPWKRAAADTWQCVPDIAGAVAALDRPACRVMLAVGRMHLADFAPNPQHHYLLRLVDPPEGDVPFPESTAIIDRGPFTLDGDLALMQDHGIDIVVSKNSGGTGAIAKILAARELGLPVIMIDRPAMPARAEVGSVEAVMDWLRDHDADLGV